MELKKKHEAALKKFVDKHKKNKNVIGILITGSFIHSDPDKNSDLDVYILTKKSKFRERGNTWIDGIEIEYFINPIKQVEHYFFEESGKGGPHTAHMFVNSRVLYKSGLELDKLIRKARKIMNKKRDKMSNVSRELAKYHLDDLEKDLEDTYLKKDKFSFNLVSMEILRFSLDVFLQITRTYEEKHKRLLKYLRGKNRSFANLYENALLENNMDMKYKKLIKLIRYIEKKIDGKRPKEWRLKGKVTY